MKQADATSLLACVSQSYEKAPAGLEITTAFRKLGGWDSLAAVLLVARLHAEFGFQLGCLERHTIFNPSAGIKTSNN